MKREMPFWFWNGDVSREEIRRKFNNRLENMIHPEDREKVRKESEDILSGHLIQLSP